ncbi:MAG: hypothetical protein ACYCO9_13105 [Streptosporangiaceae bacterium]
MRNAGDRAPGGSAGRRSRAAAGPADQAAAGSPGPSLFTPAYRVSHAAPEASDFGQPYGAGPANGGDGTDARPYRYPWEEPETDVDGHGAPAPGGASDGSADWDDDYPGYSWLIGEDDDQAGGTDWSSLGLSGTRPAPQSASRAVRGFAPYPDDPLPVYPSGPFAAWNQAPAAGPGSSTGPGSGTDPASAGYRGPGDRRDPAGGGDSVGDRGDSSPARHPGQVAATISPTDFDTDYAIPAITDPVLGTEQPVPGRDAARRNGQDRNGRNGRNRTAGSADAGPGRNGSRRTGRGQAGSASRPARGGKGGGRSRSNPGESAGSRARSAAHARHQPVRLVIGAAIVIVAGVAAFLVTSVPSTSAPTSSDPVARSTQAAKTQARPSPQVPTGPWKYISTRSTDLVPLTAAELYPQSFTSGKTGYFRAAVAASTHCQGALIGSGLQAAVRKAGCSQAVRATYLSRGIKVMATIGVFNLASFTKATDAAKAAGKSQFVGQLPAKSGPTSKIGEGTGLEEAVVKGHYLVLVWADFFNLRAPKKAAQRTELETFMAQLIQHTVNVSLSYRMVYGKPNPVGPGVG